MKKNVWIASILALVVVFAGPAWAKPVLTVEEPKFVFDPVPDGTGVSHVFVVKNTGDEPLIIHDVQPP